MTKSLSLISPTNLAAKQDRAIPTQTSYLVKLSSQAILNQLRHDANVQIGSSLPSLQSYGFSAELTKNGFFLCANLSQNLQTASSRSNSYKRIYLRVTLIPLQENYTRVQLSFIRKPESTRVNFWFMWITCFLWLYLTGFTTTKLALVGVLMAVTLPAFFFARRLRIGSDEDRLELLNYMQRLLGPSLVGENREENMPYRHEHP